MIPTTSILSATALWLLTRSPPATQQRILELLRQLPYHTHPVTLVTALKWILGLSLTRYASSALSTIALNNWRVFADTDRWNWSEEIAVVTGGCSGIGEEITKALSAKGVKVVVLDMSPLPDRLRKDVAHYIKCDITDSDTVDAAADEIRTNLGSPSILINNAGIGHDYPIFDAPNHRIKQLIDVNLTSHWYTCRAFAPDMVKRNKGHIVEIASMSSFISVGQFSSYSATKVALVALSECLREQLRTWYRAPNVHVTNVHPLWVATPLVAYRKELIEKRAGKMMSAEYVGREVADQIFRCRGTQLVIPRSHSFLRTTRAWPVWMLDLLKGMGASTREEIEAEAEKKA